MIVVAAFSAKGPIGVAGAGDSEWTGAAHGAAESIAKEAADKATALGVATVSHLALAGDPAEVLVRITQEKSADLLVVGSKGMQSTARFLLGPIANKVAHKVDCDLLIVETSE